MKTPVGLVYPPPSGAPLSYPPPSGPPPSFVPSDRWIDPVLPAFSSQHPSDSRWPAPPSSGKHERRWDRSGSIPSAQARKLRGKGLLGSGWFYYLAIGAAIGGLVFEYLIESTPVAIPQPTTVLAPPAGAELPPLVPAVPAAGANATGFANAPRPGDLPAGASANAQEPPPTMRAIEPPSLELVPRRAPPAPRPPPPAPRVRRPAAPPPAAVAPPSSSESPPAEKPAPAPTAEEPDWGI